MSNENVNQASNDDFGTLMIASQEGHVVVVQLLLAHGANVDHADKNGADALMIASQNGHVVVVQLLLANGATEGISTTHVVGKQQRHIAIVDILTVSCKTAHHTTSSSSSSL